MSYKKIILLAFICGCSKAKPEPQPISPTDAAKESYEKAISRLEIKFLDRGMVISFGGDGHRGDSLIWSGVALGSLRCDRDKPIASGIQKLVSDLDGGLGRFWDLENDVSLDGALGFYFGVSSRLNRCPAEKDAWKETLNLHKVYMASHKNAIGENGLVVPPVFDFVQHAIFHAVDLEGAPDTSELSALAVEDTGWALAVKSQKAACYRVHLAWLSLKTSENLGYNVPREAFCQETNGLGLPIIDQWCGRDGLKGFLDHFIYNQWEYRHQRCPGWETPDGDGYETPAVDYLIGLSTYYDL